MMCARESIHRIDLPRPQSPPNDSKVSAEDRITEPIGVHIVGTAPRLLFGTGYADSFSQLLDYLEHDREPDVIVVEHGDPDHYGAVPQLRKEFPDVSVAAPYDDLDQMERADIAVDIPLKHGDVIGDFEVIHVPGHTPGNLSFVDKELSVAVVGDSFVNAESSIAAPGEWSGAFAPILPKFNADSEAAKQNLPRLAKYSFDVALLTHGEDVTTGAQQEFQVLLRDLKLSE